MTSNYGSTWTAVETTLEAGGKTAGIFSLAVQGEKLVAVGGDFSLPGESSRRTVSISKDGGLTWAEPNSPTFGYRSVRMKGIRYIDIMLFSGLVSFLLVMISLLLLGLMGWTSVLLVGKAGRV